MKKTVKSIETIYGGYASKDFVLGLQHIAKEARIRAKHNRNEQTHKNIHSQETADSAEAVEFWQQIEEQCKIWLKD